MTTGGAAESVRTFSLLYTTRIDVNEQMDSAYLRMLDSGIDSNLDTFADVAAAFRQRTAATTASVLRNTNLEEYLRLGISKQLAITIATAGWEFDPDYGMPSMEIKRKSGDRRYGMLHVAMHLRRVDSSRAGRTPKVSRSKGSAYHQTVRQLFSTATTQVTQKHKRELIEDVNRLATMVETARGAAGS